MQLEALLGILVHAALCALLAAVASLLARTRNSILGYIGAGLLGHMLGLWIAVVANAGTWPGSITVSGVTTHLLWGFIGALLVIVVFKLVRRAR